MSRSPECVSPAESPEVVEPDRRLRLLSGKPHMSRQGIAVNPVLSASEATERVRWIARRGDTEVQMLVPGETANDAVVVLEAADPCPDLRRTDSGIVMRSRMSARIGTAKNHFILLIPTTGHAWDGSVHRTVDSFLQRAISEFIRHAVPRWPDRSPYPITLSNGISVTTRLRLRPEFPMDTPMLTAGRDLTPQMTVLSAITHLPRGVCISNNCIRLDGPMPREVQSGCVLGLGVRKTGETCAICIWFPDHNAVTSRRQLAEVSHRLTSCIFKRRRSSGAHGK